MPDRLHVSRWDLSSLPMQLLHQQGPKLDSIHESMHLTSVKDFCISCIEISLALRR